MCSQGLFAYYSPLLGRGVGGEASFPPPLEGSGEAPGCVLKRGGHTDKRVNHKMDFDFEFD